MEKYIVVEKPFVLAAGILELTKEQYQSRKHCLKPAKKKGQYEITGPVCFKIGEKIGYDGKVPKVVQTNLVTLEEYAKGAPEVEIEKTVEVLRADIEAANKDLIVAREKIKELEEALDAALSARDEELEAMNKDLAETKAELEKMVKLNQELVDRLEAVNEKTKIL